MDASKIIETLAVQLEALRSSAEKGGFDNGHEVGMKAGRVAAASGLMAVIADAMGVNMDDVVPSSAVNHATAASSQPASKKRVVVLNRAQYAIYEVIVSLCMSGLNGQRCQSWILAQAGKPARYPHLAELKKKGVVNWTRSDGACTYTVNGDIRVECE